MPISPIRPMAPRQHIITARTKIDCFCPQETAINRWDIDAERSINYHSLEPLLRIIGCKNCEAAQLWAVWALANLTNVSSESGLSCALRFSRHCCVVGDKYCPMVEKEGGILLLQEIFEDASEKKRMKELAGRSLAVCDVQLKEKKGLW